MGISTKHKFIFLKNHKCGSSTCYSILSKYFTVKGYPTWKPIRFPRDKTVPPWVHAPVRVWKIYLRHKRLRGNFQTITTVRNPWDRMVSLYFYDGMHSRRYGKKGFKNFIKTVKYDFTTFIFDKNGKKLIDHVIKLENLLTEMPKVFSKFGIHLTKQECSRRINVTARRKDRSYRKYYDNETKEIVRQIFKYEIEFFNYKF